MTTAALDAYLDEGGLRARLVSLLEAGDADGLRSIAFEAELPIALQAELMTAVERLPGVELVAVRSSAADEDGGSHSFAGLHETQLGVPLKGIGAAVRKCWASLWAEGAHRLPRRGRPGGRRRDDGRRRAGLVPARASAVVFTANPLTGADDEVVLHVTCGLGPTLVDNEVTPDVAVIGKSGPDGPLVRGRRQAPAHRPARQGRARAQAQRERGARGVRGRAARAREAGDRGRAAARARRSTSRPRWPTPGS